MSIWSQAIVGPMDAYSLKMYKPPHIISLLPKMVLRSISTYTAQFFSMSSSDLIFFRRVSDFIIQNVVNFCEHLQYWFVRMRLGSGSEPGEKSSSKMSEKLYDANISYSLVPFSRKLIVSGSELRTLHFREWSCLSLCHTTWKFCGIVTNAWCSPVWRHLFNSYQFSRFILSSRVWSTGRVKNQNKY